MSPCTFQNVWLSPHVNFHSGSLVWSSFVFAPVHIYKGSGSYVDLCPRPCPSTYRWARLATHRHWGPLCVYPVLLCPLWPCNHRMCVIAKEAGQSLQARTCSRTWTFLRRRHTEALRSLCLNAVHVSQPPSKKSARVSPET